MAKWLKFEDEETDRKTRIVLVGEVKTNEYLGTIEYHPPWRQYVFSGAMGETIWNDECLRELADQVTALNNGR